MEEELEVCVRFISSNARLAGHHACLCVDQLDGNARSLERSRHVLETRMDSDAQDASKYVLLLLEPGARSLALSLTPAFRSGREAPLEFSVRFFRGQRPQGSIGLAYSSPAELPRLLQNLVRHYSHYARAAKRFSVAWAKKHSVKQVMERLVGARE